jgi:hypothetical protein
MVASAPSAAAVGAPISAATVAQPTSSDATTDVGLNAMKPTIRG